MPITYGIKLDSKLVSNIDGLISLLRDNQMILNMPFSSEFPKKKKEFYSLLGFWPGFSFLQIDMIEDNLL